MKEYRHNLVLWHQLGHLNMMLCVVTALTGELGRSPGKRLLRKKNLLPLWKLSSYQAILGINQSQNSRLYLVYFHSKSSSFKYSVYVALRDYCRLF